MKEPRIVRQKTRYYRVIVVIRGRLRFIHEFCLN